MTNNTLKSLRSRMNLLRIRYACKRDMLGFINRSAHVIGPTATRDARAKTMREMNQVRGELKRVMGQLHEELNARRHLRELKVGESFEVRPQQSGQGRPGYIWLELKHPSTQNVACAA